MILKVSILSRWPKPSLAHHWTKSKTEPIPNLNQIQTVTKSKPQPNSNLNQIQTSTKSKPHQCQWVWNIFRNEFNFCIMTLDSFYYHINCVYFKLAMLYINDLNIRDKKLYLITPNKDINFLKELVLNHWQFLLWH